MHAISISISIFLFLFFYFYIFFIFWGWAGLGWTQLAKPGHWPKPVTRRLLPASVRELPTHAGYSYYVIYF
jgi:hypothetical protein